MVSLPALLDIVDEFYNNLELQPKNFADNIPMLFVPQRQARKNYCGQGNRLGRGPLKCCAKSIPCASRCPLGDCETKTTEVEDFEVSFDVMSFKPAEIAVKMTDHEIQIEGKHEEREDEFGFISRQFHRRFTLPREFDPDTVSTSLNAEGKMTIKASKPKPQVDESQERMIPIQHVPATSSKTTQLEPGFEEVDDSAAKEATDKETQE